MKSKTVRLKVQKKERKGKTELGKVQKTWSVGKNENDAVKSVKAEATDWAEEKVTDHMHFKGLVSLSYRETVKLNHLKNKGKRFEPLNKEDLWTTNIVSLKAWTFISRQTLKQSHDSGNLVLIFQAICLQDLVESAVGHWQPQSLQMHLSLEMSMT